MWDKTLIMNKFLFLIGAYLNSHVHALLCVRPDLFLKVSLVSVKFFLLREWDINLLFNPQPGGARHCNVIYLAPVIEKAIHRINHYYPLDSAIGFPSILANACLLGSD